MSVKREVPEPWAEALVRVGLVDRRNGRPSMSRLAEAVNAHTSTIAAMMYGERSRQGEDLVSRVAEVLRVDASEISGWMGRTRPVGSRFQPHQDADLLDAEERKAVNELIRLLARGKVRRATREARQSKSHTTAAERDEMRRLVRESNATPDPPTTPETRADTST